LYPKRKGRPYAI